MIRTAALIIAISAPSLACANGFFNLYASPDKPRQASARALSGAAASSFGTIDAMIPSLDQVSAGPADVGMATLVPALGDRSIPEDNDANRAIVASAASTSAVVRPSSQPRVAAGGGRDDYACVTAIRAAEKRYGIPENLLMAIGLQEAGRERGGKLTIWPWSVNSHGQTRMFETRSEAVAFVESERAAGKTLIDMGCMQINLRWHPDAFASIDGAFDPTASADYAARFLSGLRDESGDWMTAAGNYHSYTPEHHNKYLAGIRKNLEVALAYSSDFDQMISGQENSIPVSLSGENQVASARGFGQNRAPSLAGGKGYRRMASALPSREPDVMMAAAPRPPQQPLVGAWWSSESDDGPSRSIYSRRDLSPVIPALHDEAPDQGPL